MPRKSPSSSSLTADAPATRTALMDAAERLFSKQGVEATSVREIVKAAGANLGAITYHFGTKNRLALEVFTRRLEPMNRQRLAELEALEAEARGCPVKLEKILESLARATVEDSASLERRVEFIQLVSRCLQERQEDVHAFLSRQFEKVVRRYDDAILRSLPGLTLEELRWRMSFVIGGLHHGLEEWVWSDSSLAPPMPLPKKPRLSREDFIQTFVAFAAAGLRAGAVQKSRPKSSR